MLGIICGCSDIFALYSPSGRSAVALRLGCFIPGSVRSFGRFGKPAYTSVYSVRSSTYPSGSSTTGGTTTSLGRRGKGSRSARRGRRGGALLTMRFRRRVLCARINDVASSLPELRLVVDAFVSAGEESDGVEAESEDGELGITSMLTWRTRATVIVASRTISRASVGERGVVVNTT